MPQSQLYFDKFDCSLFKQKKYVAPKQNTNYIQ
jgi:hypothetical protein